MNKGIQKYAAMQHDLAMRTKIGYFSIVKKSSML